jgi:hypothetical protein
VYIGEKAIESAFELHEPLAPPPSPVPPLGLDELDEHAALASVRASAALPATDAR